MNRMFVLLALFAASAGGASIASSDAGPNAQLASQSRLYGGGHFSLSPTDVRNFAVDAHAEAASRAPYGNLEYAAPAHDEREQVTCLAIQGNTAVVGAIVTSADRPSLIGAWAVKFFADNGSPTFNSPDEATLENIAPANDAQWPAGFPYVCPSPASNAAFGLDYQSLDGGDIVIKQPAG